MSNPTKPLYADKWMQKYTPPPHDVYWLVCVTVRIKDTETGEVRERYTDLPLEGDATHPDTFNWKENNFSCDCNRHLFFTNWESDTDMPCGKSRYLANLINPVDGKIFYQEFDDPANEQ